MRKLIYGINLTADGCCDHTKVNGSIEIHNYFTNLMNDVDLIIYGRVTYELMVPYWPDVAKSRTGQQSELDFADKFNAIHKVVFSRTLETAGENTTIIRDNVEEEILKLKQLPGKNISIGGVDFPSQLIALGLIDEFYFVVHPAFAGQGRRLLDNTGIEAPFKDLILMDTEVLGSGYVALHYRKP